MTSGRALDAHLVVNRPGWCLDVEISLEAGSILALLGPNGAGKTTALRGIAGLQRLSAGHVRVNGEAVEDVAAERCVRPENRAIGVVFQDYLLFPHLSARDNVAFGLRARGTPRDIARDAADKWLARMEISDLAGQRPARLSGGQAQRVALARALAPKPQVLLLDEPLAALDAGTRMSVRTELGAHLKDFGGVTVLVTHDPLDALVLADQVMVIENGRVVQSGATASVARHPRTRYVAQLVGLNLLHGNAASGVVSLGEGGNLTALDVPAAGPVLVAVRPSAIAVYREPMHGSPRNSWRATVTSVERQGDAVRLAASGPPDVVVDVTADAVAELQLAPGAAVWLSVKASDLTVYPA